MEAQLKLPDRLFVREERDPEFPCEVFTTKYTPHGERDCETDGHYRCWECTRRHPDLVFEQTYGLFVAPPEREKE